MSLKNCKLAKRINHYSLINFQFSSAPFDFFHSFPVCAQLRWLRDISLMGAATPPSPRRGIPAHSVFLVCCKLSGEIRISEIQKTSLPIVFTPCLKLSRFAPCVVTRRSWIMPPFRHVGLLS